jgi:hypothetical protein
VKFRSQLPASLSKLGKSRGGLTLWLDLASLGFLLESFLEDCLIYFPPSGCRDRFSSSLDGSSSRPSFRYSSAGWRVKRPVTAAALRVPFPARPCGWPRTQGPPSAPPAPHQWHPPTCTGGVCRGGVGEVVVSGCVAGARGPPGLPPPAPCRWCLCYAPDSVLLNPKP